MKLLLDQNLSPKLIDRLSDIFPDSNHVYPLALDTANDLQIRAFAAENDFVIITKDADYSELHSLYGAPPKVIWIRLGNCSTDGVERILRERFNDILRLANEAESGVLTRY